MHESVAGSTGRHIADPDRETHALISNPVTGYYFYDRMHRATRPQSSNEISFPDGNVTRLCRIGFVLGVWLPS